MELDPGIAAAIRAGDTVIASSARAARALRRLHAEAQRSVGLTAWQAADILDWDSWLQRLWQKQVWSGLENRLLLSGLQEQQIWSELVRPGIEGRRLISVLGVSELAQEAWALLCDYCALNFLNGSGFAGSDVEMFRGWARDFHHRCEEEAWLSSGMLPLALEGAVQAGTVECSESLWLIGFDRVTPAQRVLIDAFGDRIRFVTLGEEEDSATQPSLVTATDAQDEIATCALWVQHVLASGRRRVAIVVPSVQAARPNIERIFRQVLAPETVAISAEGAALPFEFTLGVPLAQMPLVRSALLLLRWMERALSQEQASWLTLSGFICSDPAELLSMASFDARLRRQAMRQPEQELDTFLRFLNREWSEAKPLGDLRQRLFRAKRHFPAEGQLSFAEWTDRAGRILDDVQWPGVGSPGSEDFQAQARWSQLLDDLSALAFDGSTVDCEEFLDVLEQQAQRKIFAPESLDAPVQIMGPFEAAGLSFDALWFLGADDASWPAVAQPHPFVSQALQRKHAMPHANSDVDWQLAQQVTTRLRKSAPLCMFSYAEQDANGTCRRSTLLNFDLALVPANELRVAIGADRDLLSAHDYPATLQDEEPAAVVPWAADTVAGGAEVLGNQAACGFRSFAIKRLAARPMEDMDWGLDPRMRGQLVHTILENIWAELKDLQSLVAARQSGSLPAMVVRHVDDALQGLRVDTQSQHWNEAYLTTERARNIALVEEWLAYEAKRAVFTVETREEKRIAVVGALQLQVRVDRVDVISGGRVIIDYKTGATANTDGWDGARPDQPQLPIYAAFGAGEGPVENLQGVLLAKVVEGKVRFLGQVEDGDAVMRGEKGLADPPYSLQVLDGWRRELMGLAEQFLRGEAQVDPKRYPKTCEYCKLGGLCRIAESERGAADEMSVASGESD